MKRFAGHFGVNEVGNKNCLVVYLTDFLPCFFANRE